MQHFKNAFANVGKKQLYISSTLQKAIIFKGIVLKKGVLDIVRGGYRANPNNNTINNDKLTQLTIIIIIINK